MPNSMKNLHVGAELVPANSGHTWGMLEIVTVDDHRCVHCVEPPCPSAVGECKTSLSGRYYLK